MKITHVAEIVNITNVAGILEAEICVAENMRAVLMYNRIGPCYLQNYDIEYYGNFYTIFGQEGIIDLINYIAKNCIDPEKK